MRRILAAAALVLAASSAGAAGLLVPSGGGDALSIESMEIEVDVFDGLATTQVTQVFRNASPQPLEAIYSFPMPPGASLAGFTAWMGDVPMEGEVLPRDVARRHYQEIVHPAVEPLPEPVPFKDPGLLEEVSPREFRATIFPVPASGLQRIRITYVEQLAVARDRVRYVMPLQSRQAERSRVGGPFRLELEVRSSVPIADVEFPGTWREAVSAEQSSTNRLTATIVREDGDLDSDFVAAWSLDREAAGLDVVAHRVPGEDGTLLLLATAPFEESAVPAPTSWTLVVDVSGSMQRGRRIDVAAEAVERFLRSCDEHDTFNIVAFNVQPVALAEEPQPNDEASRARAAAWLRERRAIGGTALLPALELACELRSLSRENAIIVVSDGGLGESEPSHEKHLALARACDSRMFGLAIGNDVNAPLLRALAAETGGFTAQVSTREDLQVRGAQLRDRLRTSPWRGLKLQVPPEAGVFDVAPAELPDLWPGEQVVVAARYRGHGPATFTLTGTREGRPASLTLRAELPREATLVPEIRRAWAEARVTELEQAVRAGRAGSGAEEEIERLGVAHSIVTSRTSFLVLESDRMYEERGIERRSRAILEDEARAREERRRVADAKPVTVLDPAPRPKSGPAFGGGSLGLGDLSLAALWALAVLWWRRRG